MKKIIVLSAPSGGGKTVVSNHILQKCSNVEFSISSTTRPKREGEVDGQHYHFLEREEFERRIANGEFIEYEEIFGNLYGTLKSEVERITAKGSVVLFDIDVKGAYSIRDEYGDDTMLIFLQPPSMEVLRERLEKRNTETAVQINRRLNRAAEEIYLSKDFDYVIVNDVLSETLREVERILEI
ncbi:MAG: guanylate kinase [Ignavibacteria bacterium]|jgi:guanylate kinase|nr:guanylate kinase [Ignavibacteria bacterium]